MGKLKVLILGVSNRLREIPTLSNEIRVEDVVKYIGKELSIDDLEKIQIKLRGRNVSIDDIISTKNKIVVRVDAPPTPPVPQIKCKNIDCVFWGLPSKKGLCSICFSKSIEVPKNTIEEDIENIEESMLKKIEIKSTSLTKCQREDCKRVVGLLGFSCQCGGIYCGKHRMAEDHDCTFDFKKSGRKQLQKDNPSFGNKKLRLI